MKRVVVSLLVLSSVIPAVRPNEARSGDPAGGPAVVLRGEGAAEAAPHGEGNVYAPDILWDGGRFRMWYGGQGRDGHDRISLAESADGTTWTRKGVVLEDATANHVNDPSVVKVGDKYHMWYTRAGKDVVDRIDLAVSADGVRWEPRGVALAPGPAGAWDALSVGRPSVICEGGVFRMWYDGRKDFPLGAPVKGVPTSPTSSRSVGYATSRDGVTWIRSPNNPVYGHDAGGVDVKRVGGRLVMLSESGDGTRWATSPDGVTWTDGGMLAGRSGAAVDAFGHVTPCLLLDPAGGRHRLFVGAASAATWDRNRIAAVGLRPGVPDRAAGGRE